MRVLVTASREHHSPYLIHRVLDTRYRTWCETAGDDDEFVVVHGDAPGGDQMAKVWARSRRALDARVRDEPYPADWDRHHRAAGPKRNAVMVSKGADVCEGFPIGRSPGTRGCMRLAKKAGIPTHEYKLPPSWKAG